MQTLRTILLTAAVLAAVVAAYVFHARTRAPETQPAPPTPAVRETPDPAKRPVETARARAPAPDTAITSVMPVDGPSLEKFQEVLSATTVQLTAEQPGVPYAVAMSRAARQAITALGHNPELTLLYWLSPPFAEDVAAGNPAAAVDTLRTVDNLLAILLGDTAGPEEFAQIMDECAPDVRALAMQRRAR